MDSPQSPGWKKPSDVMRLHRRRKSVACRRMSNDSPRPKVSSTSPGRNLGRSGAAKRRNPFGCSPRKRFNLGETAAYDGPVISANMGQQGSPDLSGVLFGVMNGASKQELPAPGGKNPKQLPWLQLPVETTPTPETWKPEPKPEGSITYPMDWSLKSKARFLSKKTFAWCTPLRTVEESAGVRAFASCSPEPTPTEVGMITIADKSELQRNCLFWQHPSLPWCKLFPRITSETKIGKPGTISSDDSILKCLLSEWGNSFTSIFQMLRCRRCPYFYLCTHQFTVVFRAAGVGGRTHCHAMITPTTRGFREALNKEGIEFSLPLVQKKRLSEESETGTKNSTQTTQEDVVGQPPEGSTGQDEEEEDEDDLAQTDEGASSWLESIGLDTSRFKSLDPDKVKLSREGFRTIDHRPESLVLVEGADTQALYNYLLNCRSCVAAMGAQLGIPPTIISPVCFKGATLGSLKVKVASVRQQMSAERQAEFGFHLEVSGGPILPCSLQGLVRLFSRTQGQFTASFSTHEPTTPFNGVSGQEPDSEDVSDHNNLSESVRECGISASHWKNVLKGSSFGKQGIKELQYAEGLFNWTS